MAPEEGGDGGGGGGGGGGGHTDARDVASPAPALALPPKVAAMAAGKNITVDEKILGNMSARPGFPDGLKVRIATRHFQTGSYSCVCGVDGIRTRDATGAVGRQR